MAPERADWEEVERFVELGSTLNEKYRIEHVIGMGGMGVVVAARHLKLGETVAIKFLLPRALGHRRRVERFQREARALSRIRGPHAARIFDVDVRSDGAPFIVMEYLDGETLAAHLKQEGPLEIPRTVDVLLEVCEAIAEAHSYGIVHRDLKPGNLFLARGPGGIELVKVLDFGISKFTLPEALGDEFTTGDAFMGSPRYMSPEQLVNSAQVDTRTDIWSLGVIFYECLTGDVPFKADDALRLFASNANDRRPSLDALRPGLPASLSKAVELCMTPERNGRFPDVLSLAREVAPHGTARSRRALEVIEAIGSRPRPSVPHAEPSIATLSTTAPRLDTGTLSAAAEPKRPSGVPPRATVSQRATVVLGALVATTVGVAFVSTRRPAEAPLPGTTATDGPSAPAKVLPSFAPAALHVPPPPSAQASAEPRASTSVKAPKSRVLSATPPASATARSFDPVFDERR